MIKKNNVSAAVFEKIKQTLDARGVSYQTFHHEPTRTSEDAARIRGVSLASGAKAIVLCGDKTGQHVLCILPANRKLDGAKMKQLLGEKMNFAPDPIAVTDCEPGSVPPLGSVLGLKTYCDSLLAQQMEINFNAGLLTDSIRMMYSDYITVESPVIADLSKE